MHTTQNVRLNSPSPSASEVTTIWRYTNVYIIIIIKYYFHTKIVS